MKRIRSTHNFTLNKKIIYLRISFTLFIWWNKLRPWGICNVIVDLNLYQSYWPKSKKGFKINLKELLVLKIYVWNPSLKKFSFSSVGVKKSGAAFIRPLSSSAKGSRSQINWLSTPSIYLMERFRFDEKKYGLWSCVAIELTRKSWVPGGRGWQIVLWAYIWVLLQLGVVCLEKNLGLCIII